MVDSKYTKILLYKILKKKLYKTMTFSNFYVIFKKRARRENKINKIYSPVV